MNKYVISIIIAIVSFSAAQSAVTSEQIGQSLLKPLVPHIVNNAQQWVESYIRPLEFSFQLAYLNLFAFVSPQLTDSFEKISEMMRTSGTQATNPLQQCLQFIESNAQQLTESRNAFEDNIMDVFLKYLESIDDYYKTTATKKPLSSTEEAQIFEILTKEFIVLVYTINYEILYKDIAKNHSNKLKYMFDKNGIIAEGKRTTALPRSI